MDIMIIINMILHKMVSITTLLLTLISIYSTFCFPTKPLNERTTQLAWQAWLLVDDQNQTKQNGPEGILRRRITPKSVFIAPTFSPEYLPDCAEGYTSDSMGRCIKIIKLDEDMHLEFLLQKLNEKFGGMEDNGNGDLETRDTTTSGPLQLTIPLVQENNNNMGTEQTDVAIVVAPTSSDFSQAMEGVKTMNKDMGNAVNVKTIAHILGVKQEDLETTTIMDTSVPTTDMPTIQQTENDETTASTTEIGNTETTTFEIPTDERAIFFMMPTTTEPNEQTVPSTVITTEINEDNQEYTATSTEPQDLTTLTQLETVAPITTTEYHVNSNQNFVKFPDDTITSTSNVHTEKRTANFRFPDERARSDLETLPQDPHEQLIFSRDISDHVRTVSFEDDSKMLNDYPDVKNYRHSHHRDRLETATIDTIHQNNHHIFSNSNKHSNLFLIPPVRWGDSSQQKPLVLRFSRKQDSINTRQFNNNPQYFRHIPSGDLSYVFGFKHKQNSHSIF